MKNTSTAFINFNFHVY